MITHAYEHTHPILRPPREIGLIDLEILQSRHKLIIVDGYTT
jgi:hypothetical protein